MKSACRLLVVACVIFGVNASAGATQGRAAAKIPETPHLQFVREVVRELAAIEEIRDKGEKELKAEPDHIFANMIHSGTLFKLELGSQVEILNGMHIGNSPEEANSILARCDENKMEAWEEMVGIGGEFMNGPRAGVDYQKLGARVPELRAGLEYLDQTIFQSMPLVFATLINLDKANSQGHADHLIITKVERRDLIDYIDRSFGEKINEKKPNYTVASAAMIRSYLNKDLKSSDDPWN
jgi:hypothetical protein